MKNFKKYVYMFMIATVMISAVIPTVSAAYEGEKRVAVGADLTLAQKSEIYDMFGIQEGTVAEITVTNEEEREYLEGVVSESIIGTRALSCVFLEIRGEGEGLEVTTKNINWCTDEIYKNTLMTVGIYDAVVVVAAPFNVSGTAALTGIYKAYEEITGEKMSNEVKAASTEELITTSELADVIGEADATQIVNELKKILDQTSEMTDDALKTEILTIAESMNVELTDEQINQLIKLVRSLEKMDTSELIERVNGIKDTIISWSAMGDKISEFFINVKNFFTSVSTFFSNLFGGK